MFEDVRVGAMRQSSDQTDGEESDERLESVHRVIAWELGLNESWMRERLVGYDDDDEMATQMKEREPGKPTGGGRRRRRQTTGTRQAALQPTKTGVL